MQHPETKKAEDKSFFHICNHLETFALTKMISYILNNKLINKSFENVNLVQKYKSSRWHFQINMNTMLHHNEKNTNYYYVLGDQFSQ